MYKIAVIGDSESILSFKAIGLETCPVESAAEARKALHGYAKEDYAVIYLTEQFAQDMESELKQYATEIRPAVILIPGREGSLGLGLANIGKAVERAVGSNILDA